MFFPISNTHISPIYLAVVGFLIGILGGFFGVGGSFIAGPALRLMGVDWNYAVGTDLAHIVGKSIVAARQHRSLGNVDLKLGFFMAFGTIGGAECGAQLIQALKRAGNVNMVVSWVSIVVYFSIAVFMLWESQKRCDPTKSDRREQPSKEDRSAFGPGHAKNSTAETLANDRAAHVRCKQFHSGLFFWLPLSVGLFSGFLGGGAGYIRMPSMVYVLGIPTHLAVGTDLLRS